MTLRDSMTVGEILALPTAERGVIMHQLMSKVATLRAAEVASPAAQQGDGSVGVPVMPAAYEGTLLVSDTADGV